MTVGVPVSVVGLSGPDRVGLVAFLVVGALGGAHCLGMCGPLVTVYADRMAAADGRPADAASSRRPDWYVLRQHALFNAGRTVSYALVGALAGAAGTAVFTTASLLAVGDAVRAAVGLVVGVTVIRIGASYLLRGAVRLPRVPVAGDGVRRLSGALTARADRLATGPGIVALGALHGLMPCPLLYPAFLYALGRGSPAVGGLSLLALGLGTFPTLFIYGVVLESANDATRRGLQRGLGVAFVFLGLVPLANALGLLGVPVPSPPLPMPGGPWS